MKKNKQSLSLRNRGAITIIFLMIIALVLMLIMAATQSRLLLSLSRSRSAADILVATYQAESEANDIMAKLVGGYLDNANISETKHIGDMRIEIKGQELDGTQIVTVTAFRGLVVGKVQAVRRLLSVEEVDEVEIVLMLDCTGSMDDPSGTTGKTRFNAQEEAAINFVNNISSLSDADKFRLGIGVFGVDARWLTANGEDITPGSGISFNQMANALEDGFGNKRTESPACANVIDSTSVGTAYRFGHDYLATSKTEGVKQIEIVITDGEPNSRIEDLSCPPSRFCQYTADRSCLNPGKDYLRCTLADTEKFVSELNQNGVRDPEVDAYGVTIFANPPQDVVAIFQNYASEGGYFNATRASQLSEILDNILGQILEDRSTITLKRIIPTPQ